MSLQEARFREYRIAGYDAQSTFPSAVSMIGHALSSKVDCAAAFG